MSQSKLSPDVRIRRALATVRRCAAELESATPAPTQHAIAPGDVVQMCPGSHDQWSGMLVCVTSVHRNTVKGHFLMPHRGGLPYVVLTAAQVRTVGTVPFTLCRWGFERWFE